MTRGALAALAGLTLLVAGVTVAAADAGPTPTTGPGTSTSAARSPQPDGVHVVLVSGRDDHGLQELPSVGLSTARGGSDLAGRVNDQTLALVLAREGTQVQVRTLEGPAVAGWVDDYRLRGVLHLLGPSSTCRPVLGDRPVPTGQQVRPLAVAGARVLVQAVTDPALRGWVQREELAEVPSESPCLAPTGAAGGPAKPAPDHHGHHH